MRMEKHIYDEKNGLGYTLHGDYYLPDIVLDEEKPTYGKYGMIRKRFLKEYRPAKYQYLLLTGKLTGHLNQVDKEAREEQCLESREGPCNFFDNDSLYAKEHSEVVTLWKYLCCGFYSCFWIQFLGHGSYISPPLTSIIYFIKTD